MPFRMGRSLAGARFGIDAKGRTGGDGRFMGRGPRDPMPYCEFGDDFLGDVLADQWGNATKGSDAATVDFAVLSGGLGGIIRGTTGAGAGASMAVNGIQIHSYLNWKASTGSLAMSARVKMAAITTVSFFVGFTDQIAALEMPIHSAASANTITTNATDAVGFFFDTSMTTAQWWCAGVANDVDATAVASGVAPTAATWQDLRVEVDTNGKALFFIDGKTVGTVSSAVTTSVALTPVLAGFRRAASSTTFDCDYIHVESERG